VPADRCAALRLAGAEHSFICVDARHEYVGASSPALPCFAATGAKSWNGSRSTVGARVSILTARQMIMRLSRQTTTRARSVPNAFSPETRRRRVFGSDAVISRPFFHHQPINDAAWIEFMQLAIREDLLCGASGCSQGCCCCTRRAALKLALSLPAVIRIARQRLHLA
jgi:hypothetical protein